MRLPPILTAVLATLLSLSAYGQGNDAAPIRKWISRQGEVRSVQADFVQKRVFRSLRDPLATPGHFWYSAPGAFRWELGEPVKTIVIHNGAGGYVIQPAKKRAERLTDEPGKIDPSNPLQMMNFPMAKTYDEFNRKFEVLSVAPAGTRCHVELLPRDLQARKYLEALRLDFDTGDGKLIAFELALKDGSSLRNEFSNVRFNQKIDPRVFEFDLAGYEVIDAKH